MVQAIEGTCMHNFKDIHWTLLSLYLHVLMLAQQLVSVSLLSSAIRECVAVGSDQTVPLTVTFSLYLNRVKFNYHHKKIHYKAKCNLIEGLYQFSANSKLLVQYSKAFVTVAN